jgi:choline dehydrogenase-like flavoprotein
MTPGGGHIDSIRFSTLGGKKFSVAAKQFILAASALENTRLLLVSNDVCKNGIGNENDLVGRFFMEHPHIFIGTLTPEPGEPYTDYYKTLNYDGNACNLGTVATLGFSESHMRRSRLLNASAFFVRRKDYKVEDRYFSEGALAWTRVMDVFNHTTAPKRSFFQDVKTALRNRDIAFNMIAKKIKAIKNPQTAVSVRAQIETAPNPDSRVLLSHHKDRFGMNRLSVDWRLTSLDLHSFHTFQKTLCAALENMGYSMRIFKHEFDDTGWPVTMLAGKHHMGTTRMHNDPKKGVVDASCRVHTADNLFVAGSSVFPTSGQANPMLTSLALTIRLSDHIKSIMNK